MLWDCHCHLSFLQIEQVEAIFQSRPQASFVMGGYQPSEWESQLEIRGLFPNRVKTCFGLHPWFVRSQEFDIQRDLQSLKNQIDHADFIGEVGLDFFGDIETKEKEIQIEAFEQQLALETSKTFIFHIVQAHGQALDSLKKASVRGVVHSFSGAPEVAHRYFDQGHLLSFGPSLLNANFKKARASLKALPAEAILIESDTPSNPIDDGNTIEQLEKVYQGAAEIRGVPVEELVEQVAVNLQGLF